MHPKLIIVGAGLGGSFLAAGLHDSFDVTVLELADISPVLRDRINDVDRPAVTYPHLDSGLGGTTKIWHNALMEIDSDVFKHRWPFKKSSIDYYYNKAYMELAQTTQNYVSKVADNIKVKLLEMGLPSFLINHHMLIPKSRINAWNHLKLDGKVKTVIAEVLELLPDQSGKIEKVSVLLKDGTVNIISSDFFVLCAGGLGTPLLLQNLSQKLPVPCLKNAGLNYEDHPCAFVGEVILNRPLYKFWNYPVKANGNKANVRIPFSLVNKGLSFSFQLRPAHHLSNLPRKKRVVSVLSELRNYPFRIKNYLKLARCLDDLYEIASFKFGLRIPTRKYSVLMVSEQYESKSCSVWKDASNQINRRWDLGQDYIIAADEAINIFKDSLRPLSKNSHFFHDWHKNIFSSSHHTGTARMSKDSQGGVCDQNGRVFGIENLFICDASAIPGSGFVNTGLTIVALAMRMSSYFCSSFAHFPKKNI